MTKERMTLRTLVETIPDAVQLRPKLRERAACRDEVETGVLAFRSFPKDHRLKFPSSNPLERPIGEIKRRIGVVGIVPNDDAITRLVGALPIANNDEWAVQRPRVGSLHRFAIEVHGASSGGGRVVLQESPSLH
jgi:transposase-like protein